MGGGGGRVHLMNWDQIIGMKSYTSVEDTRVLGKIFEI